MKDILAEAAFTAAVARLTKAAVKNGIDKEECEAIFAAVVSKNYPAPKTPVSK
jgi:hypothetical protein